MLMRSVGTLIVVAAAGLLFAGAASSVPQFTPNATSLLHTTGSGEPGAEWDTGGPAAGGSISYSGGVLTVTAALDVMNYYDTASGSGCETDTGSNCAFNYGPDLDITFSANFVDLVVTPVFGTVVSVVANFETTGGPDLSVTDPDDGGSTQLEADLVAGTFGATATTGLSAEVFYDTATGTAFGGGTVNATAILIADSGTAYASLFGTTELGILFAATGNFVNGGPTPGGLDEILSDSIAAMTLVDFTAEGEGQVFRTTSGQFVPEPSTLALLCIGAGGLFLHGGRHRRA